VLRDQTVSRDYRTPSSQPSNFLLVCSSRYITIPQVTLFLLASAVSAASYLLEPIRADHQTSHTQITTTYIQLNLITPQTLHKPSTTPPQPLHNPSVTMDRLGWALNHLISQSSAEPESSSDSVTSSDSGSATSCSDSEEPAPVLFHGPHGRFNHPIALAKNGSRIYGFILKSPRNSVAWSSPRSRDCVDTSKKLIAWSLPAASRAERGTMRRRWSRRYRSTSLLAESSRPRSSPTHNMKDGGRG
jgi:hypothetical protein